MASGCGSVRFVSFFLRLQAQTLDGKKEVIEVIPEEMGGDGEEMGGWCWRWVDCRKRNVEEESFCSC